MLHQDSGTAEATVKRLARIAFDRTDMLYSIWIWDQIPMIIESGFLTWLPILIVLINNLHIYRNKIQNDFEVINFSN